MLEKKSFQIFRYQSIYLIQSKVLNTFKSYTKPFWNGDIKKMCRPVFTIYMWEMYFVTLMTLGHEHKVTKLTFPT